jgi:phosphoglycolate phosphatase
MIPPGRIALVFDMDNTVISSHIDFAAIRRQLIGLLRAAGATGETDEVLLRRAIAQLVALGTAHDRAHGTEIVPRMWEVIEAHEAEGLKDAGALDDAPAVLRRLKERGHRIAILTNNGRQAALAALRSAGLAACVEVVVARGDAPALKPAGDGAAEAARRLGTVERTYVIGDSWIDGAAAAAVGARFIAYRRTAEDLRPHGIRPWCVIGHLDELLRLSLAD